MSDIIKTPDYFNIPIQSVDYAKDLDEVPFFEKRSSVLQQIMPEKQVDLAYGTALYVSQGGNKNGYYFSNHLLLANYKTGLLKPINVGHSAEFIVGVVYDVALSKKGDTDNPEPKFSLIEDSRVKVTSDKGIYTEGYRGEVDVWTHFVLFKIIYPGVVEVLKENVSGNMEYDKYFMSMEILFDDYKYLWDEDEATAFDRTYKNQYLDEYIGKTFEGRKLFKMYTGPVAFGGGGIVSDPAESRAVLADVANKDVAATNLSIKKDGDLYKVYSLNGSEMGRKEDKDRADNNKKNSNKEELIMADDKIDVAKMVQDVENNVLERVKSLQAVEKLDKASATIAAQKEEITSLTKNLQDVSAASDDAIHEAEGSLEESNSKLDESNTKITELENKNKELENNQMTEEDKKELADYRIHKLSTERLEDLSSKKIIIPEDKKGEVMEKLGKFSNEEYSAYVSALEMAGVKDEAANKGAAGKDTAGSKDTGKTGAEGKAADKILSNASVTPDADLQQDTASADAKSVNFKSALRSVTTRTKENPRGGR